MPLVVPILRFFVVFLNVYETFKTLKPPPPSARRGGQPSARAISQRKRDLKGCLAVWVVWCCYAAYERTFDRVVAIILPFYSEIKSVFLLFLVLTRAKGAEPLFLHVLRPLVKPYAAVIDPVLEISCDIGDFLFALLQVPVDYVLSSPWFHLWRADSDSEEGAGKSSSESRVTSTTDSKSSARANNYSSIPVLTERGAVQRVRVQGKHGSVRSVSDSTRSRGSPTSNAVESAISGDRHLKSSSIISLPAYSEHPNQAPPRYSRTLSRHNEHQIWYPSASAYVASGQEAPAAPLVHPETAPEYHSPEWRSYPAFPSAYPPTPLPASTILPNSVAARSDNDHRGSSSAYPPIPEDEQVCGKTLEWQQEGHTGFIRSPSHKTNTQFIANVYDESSDTRQPDEDTLIDDSMCSSETGLSEDDFGASLRTPHRFPEVMLSSAHSSVDNLTNTRANAGSAPPLRTRTSSDSLSSGSSSLAGRKRTYGGFQGVARDMFPVTHSRNATLRGKSTPIPVTQDPLQSGTSEDEDKNEVGHYGNIKVKKQRVLEPFKRNSTVRPTSRDVGNAHKASHMSRNIATRGRVASQATLRARGGSVTINSSTLKGRKVTYQSVRGGSQGVVKSSSTSSSQSGSLKERVY